MVPFRVTRISACDRPANSHGICGPAKRLPVCALLRHGEPCQRHRKPSPSPGYILYTLEVAHRPFPDQL